jgi:hypothetical protein
MKWQRDLFSFGDLIARDDPVLIDITARPRDCVCSLSLSAGSVLCSPFRLCIYLLPNSIWRPRRKYHLVS